MWKPSQLYESFLPWAGPKLEPILGVIMNIQCPQRGKEKGYVGGRVLRILSLIGTQSGGREGRARRLGLGGEEEQVKEAEQKVSFIAYPVL